MQQVDSAQARFLNNPQSTHDTAVCTSVGTVLLTLWEQHNPGGESPQEKDISILCYDGLFDLWDYENKHAFMLSLNESLEAKYIAQISEEIKKQKDPELDAAWDYIKNIIEENPDELDLLALEKDGKPIQYCIPLKSALCLVYATLTDLNQFPNACSEKDQSDRLLTLFSCFKKRKQNPVCHSGLRNDFVFTLSGIHRSVKLMVDTSLFIQNMMSEHLGLILEKFRAKDFTTYFSILLNELTPNSERHVALKEATTQAIPALREEIIKQFQAHGIPSKSCSVLIDGYLDCFDDIAIPYGSSSAVHALAGILQTQTNKKNPDIQNTALNMTKQWTRENVDLENTKFTSAVIAFEKTNNIYQIFKQYQKILSICNDDAITPGEIEQLSQFFTNYYENCIRYQAPQIISEQDLKILNNFSNIFENYKKDARVHEIENFFADWDAAREEDDSNQIQQRALYAKLLDPIFQSKFILPEKYLELLEYATEIDFTPYSINCFFLHAITVPPEEWSPLFFKYFSMAYDFVTSDELEKNSDNRIMAMALKKYSYKPKLLDQLKSLQRYYKYKYIYRFKSIIPPEDHYILVKYHVKTLNDLWELFFLMPDKKWDDFSNSLENKFLSSLLHNADTLIALKQLLSEEKWNSFILELDDECLISIAKYENDSYLKNPNNYCRKSNSALMRLNDTQIDILIDILKPMKDILTEDRLLLLTASLDNEILAAGITCYADLCFLKEILSAEKWGNFVITLDDQFLIGIANHENSNHIRFPILLDKKINELKCLRDIMPKDRFILLTSSLNDRMLAKAIRCDADLYFLEENLPQEKWNTIVKLIVLSMNPFKIEVRTAYNLLCKRNPEEVEKILVAGREPRSPMPNGPCPPTPNSLKLGAMEAKLAIMEANMPTQPADNPSTLKAEAPLKRLNDRDEKKNNETPKIIEASIQDQQTLTFFGNPKKLVEIPQAPVDNPINNDASPNSTKIYPLSEK